MRRTPWATPVSSVSLKKAMSPVRATWVPPQNSFDSPMRHDAHRVAVLLAEEGDGAGLLGVGDGQHGGVGGDVLADARVHQVLDLLLLLVGQGGGVREVEAQAIGRHQRALLGDVRRRGRGAAPSAGGASPSGCGGCRRAARRRRSARRCRRRAARPLSTSAKWTQSVETGRLQSRTAQARLAARRSSRRRPSARPARRRTASRRRSTATSLENGPTTSTSLPSATSATTLDDADGLLVAEELRGPDAVGDLLEHGRHRHLARALELAARGAARPWPSRSRPRRPSSSCCSAMTRVRSSGKP